jgi:hypothetical protein
LEEEGGASRPDIVINDIAIELKGPTTDENIKIIRQLSALIFTIFAKRISLRSF